MFVPLSSLAFATISPTYRAEASSLFTLIRNLGSSAGISVVEALQTNNVEVVHSSLVSRLTSGAQNLATLPSSLSPATAGGAEALNAEVNRQAAMVAYIDDFQMMMMLSFFIFPLLLLMRGRKRTSGPSAAPDLEAQGAH